MLVETVGERVNRFVLEYFQLPTLAASRLPVEGR